MKNYGNICGYVLPTKSMKLLNWLLIRFWSFLIISQFKFFRLMSTQNISSLEKKPTKKEGLIINYVTQKWLFWPLHLFIDFPLKLFCDWTVANSSTPSHSKVWRNLRTTPYESLYNYPIKIIKIKNAWRI